jgi:antitoxin CptB
MHDPDRINRLKFRAWRRGFREADLILGPFVDTHARELTPDQLDRLDHLLDQADQDIYEWIIGRAQAPTEFDTDVLHLIQNFRFGARAARDDLGA